MPREPRIGDAFGLMLQDCQQARDGTPGPRPVMELVERDDGYLNAQPADHYLAAPPQWPALDLRMLARLDGPTLDIGTGAGRFALALQDRGVPVLAVGRQQPGAARLGRADAVVPGRVGRDGGAGRDCGSRGHRPVRHQRPRVPRLPRAQPGIGRMGGQLRIRIRYRAVATDWFDYLFCTPEELTDLLRDTDWRLSEVDDADPPPTWPSSADLSPQ